MFSLVQYNVKEAKFELRRFPTREAAEARSVSDWESHIPVRIRGASGELLWECYQERPQDPRLQKVLVELKRLETDIGGTW